MNQPSPCGAKCYFVPGARPRAAAAAALIFCLAGCAADALDERASSRRAGTDAPAPIAANKINTIPETPLQLRQKWLSAKTERSRVDVCLAAMDAHYLVKGEPIDACKQIFGADFQTSVLPGANSWQAIVFCTPPRKRDRPGWDVGRWYLHVAFHEAPAPDGTVRRIIDNYFVTNYDPLGAGAPGRALDEDG